MKSKITDYIYLFKFRYHISFVLVIIGALIFTEQPFNELIKPLFVLYFSFNVLLYGGLYMLNDIADIESDKKHPTKKNRPLPSGSITVPVAGKIAFLCVFGGLSIIYLYFSENIFLICLLFILVNCIYTYFVKKIPHIEIVFNSLTHPMRFLLGAMLTSSKIPYLLLIAILLFATGFAYARRIIERKSFGWEARNVLRYYSVKQMTIFQITILCAIATIAVIHYPYYGIWYALMIVLYLIFVLGIHIFGFLDKFYKWLWLY